jgi:hypothetical protein
VTSRLPLAAAATAVALVALGCGSRAPSPQAGSGARTSSTTAPQSQSPSPAPTVSTSQRPSAAPSESSSAPGGGSQGSGDGGSGGSQGQGRCPAGQVSVSQAGTQGAAGSEYDDFAVTNTGSARCTVRGYPKLVPLDASGKPIPVDVSHEQPAPKTVALDPGKKATLTIRTSRVTCQSPQTAAAFKITLPGANSATRVSAHHVTVCRHGTLHERALEPQS